MITIFYQFAGRLQITRELESDETDDDDEEEMTGSPQ